LGGYSAACWELHSLNTFLEDENHETLFDQHANQAGTILSWKILKDPSTSAARKSALLMEQFSKTKSSADL